MSLFTSIYQNLPAAASIFSPAHLLAAAQSSCYVPSSSLHYFNQHVKCLTNTWTPTSNNRCSTGGLREWSAKWMAL